MSKLKGFWKDDGTAAMKADRNAARAKVRKKKSKAPWLAKPTSSETFLKSLAWRQIRYLALKNTDGRCQCCGASAADGVQLHVDHIKPRKTHPQLALCLGNLQVLCQDCNIGKGSWDSTNWAIKMERES